MSVLLVLVVYAKDERVYQQVSFVCQGRGDLPVQSGARGPKLIVHTIRQSVEVKAALSCGLAWSPATPYHRTPVLGIERVEFSRRTSLPLPQGGRL